MKTKPNHPRVPTWLAAMALFYLSTQAAQAHIVSGEAGGFASGFHHPWSGWDHILAMVAVGMWGAQLGQPAIWLLPVTFPLIMSVGGFLAVVGKWSLAFTVGGVELHADELGIALSMMVLGVMVCREAKPPLWVAAVLVGFFGMCHGYAHGKELPPGESGLLYSIGFVIATGTLHCVGITIGLIHRWPIGKKALRVAGAVVALGGIYFSYQDYFNPEVPEKPENKTAQAPYPTEQNLFFDHGLHG
jgi:urease accessory protein